MPKRFIIVDGSFTPGNVPEFNAAGDLVDSGGQGGVSAWILKTSAYTAVSGDHLLTDTSGGAFTITLPPTPTAGSVVTLADAANWSISNLTVGRNGSTIEGVAEDMVFDVGGVTITFIYDGTTWELFASAVTSAQTGTGGSGGFEQQFLLMGA